MNSQIDDQSREIANRFIGQIQTEGLPAPDIFPPLSEAWTTVFKTGILQDQKTELLKKYPTPKNLLLSRAPPINPEVKTALMSSKSGVILKKDSYQMDIQGQLGIGLCALGEAFSDLLKKEVDDKFDINFSKVNTFLGDAGRILADVHHEISVSRRACLTPYLSHTAKNVSEDSQVGSSLFGEDFSDRFKSTVAMEKSAKDLIKVTQAPVVRKPTVRQEGHRRMESLNAKAPVKKTYPKRFNLSGGRKFQPNARRSPRRSPRRSYYPKRRQ